MRHPHERLLAHDLDAVECSAVGDERDIQFVAANSLGEPLRTFADDRHLHERVLARKTFHDRRHEHFGVVVRNAEPHLAGEPLLAHMHHGLGFDAQHLARELDQPLAVSGEFDAAAALHEQRPAELLFETADVHGHRRLGFVDALSGTGEGTGVDDGHKGAELVGIEHGNSSPNAMDDIRNIRWTDQ